MRALPILLIAGLTGCSRMAIDGQVVDVTGNPIPGATITAVGTSCQTKTDDSGAFELVCNPGVFTVTVGAQGYLSEEFPDYEATERKRYDLGQRIMVKIPSQQGLLLFDKNSYLPMATSRLVRQMGGRGAKAYKHYCLPDPKPEALTRLQAGTHPFFDNKSKGWKAWQLDDEGCAYRMAAIGDNNKWEKTYSKSVEFQSTVVDRESDQTIILMALEPGEYFIADWPTGFFKKEDATETLPEGYSGHYIVVE